MSEKNFTFPKHEKLKSRKSIEYLFQNGKTLKAFPLQLIFAEVQQNDTPFQIAFSVPKRKIKLAVNRNKIKRLMRESYRLNKHLLFEITADENTKKYVMMMVYLSKDFADFKTIHHLTVKLFKKLSAEIKIN